MPNAKILIVGGGPAGLSTAGALKQVGIESTILDSGERIGQSWEQRYDRLRLHTIRSFSGLAHFPIPGTYPKYLSKDQYARYLREYASHFDLTFLPGRHVTRIRQEQPGWAVETGSDIWSSRIVVVATGQYNHPIYPNWPGLFQYGGNILHSSKFQSGRDFHSQRVLVIGAGNSGMEIAVDLVEQGASKVVISIRSGPPVVPRDFLGTPAQVFGILMNPLPPKLSDKIGSILARLALGDLNRYGLPPADWMPFRSRRTPVIDVGFARALKAGSIAIRPAVHSFTTTGVIYQDYSQEAFEAVILATGFRSGLEQILEPQGLLDNNGYPRFPSAAATAFPGLYFMGFFDSLRGFLYESNLASRRLARVIQASMSVDP